MKQTRRAHLAMLGGAAAATVLPVSLKAEDGPVTHEVQMLNADPENKRERNVFNPPVLKVNVGDTVKFVNADKGHNAQVDDNMMPEGGTEFKGRINQEIEVTFDTDGTYGYYCLPHRALGMVGLVLVGDASVNFEEAKAAKQRGKAAARYEEYFAMAEEMMAEGETADS
ncbi:MAG: pseudoazurin [Pseudomonadota bacterium]